MRVDYRTAVKEFYVRRAAMEAAANDGVAIADVAKDSPAWQQGLRPEMFITHVDDTPVSTPKEFQAATSGKTGPVAVRLLLPPTGNPVRTIPPETK
jgi:S1-C subfamily serine protease